jgi:hypothetical protein
LDSLSLGTQIFRANLCGVFSHILGKPSIPDDSKKYVSIASFIPGKDPQCIIATNFDVNFIMNILKDLHHFICISRTARRCPA